MSIEVYIEELEEHGILKTWAEDFDRNKLEVAPKSCTLCKEGVWEGYHVERTGLTYCTTCYNTLPLFDKPRAEYKKWGVEDLDTEKYKILAITRRVKAI